MKAIILILMLVMSTFAHQENLEVGPKDIAQFIQGFLKGALGEDFGDIEACMGNADSLIHDIESIIKSIGSGKIDWMDLVIHIGALIKDVPDAIKNCKSLPSKITDTFKAWISKIKNPFNIIKIIANATLHYLSRLTGDVKNFLDHWKGQRYRDSGESLGDIPFVLFTKCEMESRIPDEAVFEVLISE